MPQLVYAGIKFSVNSDDFFLPSMIGVVVRVVFSSLTVALLVITSSSACLRTENEIQLNRLLGMFFMVAMSSLVVFASLFFASTRGSPVDVKGREYVGPLLILTLLTYVAQAVIAGMFTALAITWESSGTCTDSLSRKFYLVIACVVVLWIDVLAYGIATYLFLHRYEPKKIEKIHLNEFETKTMEWEKCCKTWCQVSHCLTCHFFGYLVNNEESNQAVRAGAEVLNAFFQHSRLTLTDLLAGLILLRLDQRSRRMDTPMIAQSYFKKVKKKKHGILESSKHVMQSPEENESDAMEVLHDFEAHSGYMLAMYGWKMQLYAHRPWRGLRNVTTISPHKMSFASGDNCFKCNHKTLLSESGLKKSDVVYAQFSSHAPDGQKSIQIPHAVLIAKEKKEIVIALRGTFSLQDMLADVLIAPQSLTEAGDRWGFDGKGHYAHSGMLQVANRIRNLLENNQVLHKLLKIPVSNQASFSNSEDLDIDYENLPNCTGFSIVVTGHSLGAGVGAILTLMLRPTFTGTRCVGFAVPGPVFSFEMAEMSKEWCNNLFRGHDIAPKLNWQSLNTLRFKVMDLLRRCKVSKSRIFRSLFLKENVEDLLYDRDQVPQTPGRNQMQESIDYLENKRKSKVYERILLYSPGRLLHMANVESVYGSYFCCSQKERVYEPHWVLDRTFPLENIEISTRNLFDHFPDGYDVRKMINHML